jgi:hypothetical protein
MNCVLTYIFIFDLYKDLLVGIRVTVKHVYKGHSMESENVPFMSSCPLYTGSNCMHYSLHGENKTSLNKQ